MLQKILILCASTAGVISTTAYVRKAIKGISVLCLLLLPFNSQSWALDYMAGLSDPTRPYNAKKWPVKKASKKKWLILQSTLVSPERRSAVINGIEKTIGSSIYGAKIIDIKPYEVIVMRDGRKETLSMLPGNLIRSTSISRLKHD